MRLSGFRGATDTLRAMVEAAQGPRGERSQMVRHWVERIVSELQPKNYAGEIVAVRNWVAENVRYTNDPTHVEWVKDPQRLVEEWHQNGVAIGDCDDMGTLIGTGMLLLGRQAQLIAVGFGKQRAYSHVFCRALEPRTNQWIVCDPVAGTDERQMLERVTTWQIWSLDEPPTHGPVEER